MPHSDDLVKQGWHFWSRRTREGFEKALDCFQQAAVENPSDFRAFEGISLCYLLLGTYGMRLPREMYNGFQQAHRRAVELCGLTPERRADRAHGLHLFEHKMEEAETELLQAQAESPESPEVYVRLTMLYVTQGRLDDALNILLRARATHSLWPTVPANEILVRFFRREFEPAVACGKKALELHPYLYLGRLLLWRGAGIQRKAESGVGAVPAGRDHVAGSAVAPGGRGRLPGETWPPQGSDVHPDEVDAGTQDPVCGCLFHGRADGRFGRSAIRPFRN